MEEGLSSLSRSLSGTLLKGGGIDRGCFYGRRIKFQIHQFCLFARPKSGKWTNVGRNPLHATILPTSEAECRVCALWLHDWRLAQQQHQKKKKKKQLGIKLDSCPAAVMAERSVFVRCRIG